jgi:NodT family efflux transporter outer membrane factor (OMF) lipoprotein
MRSDEASSRNPLHRAGVLLLLATTGCPISPKYVRPEVPLNASWSQQDPRLATKIAVDIAWWKSFNDPTLDRLIETAYQQNLPLQIAGLRILEARAQLGIAIGQQYPTNQNPIGSASLTGLKSHTPDGTDLNLLAGRFLVGFDALWEVDFWGKYRRGVKAAKATYFATLADYDDALVALTAEVARTYALIRTFQVLIDLARQNVAVQEEGWRIADARFRNGATSELDVAQAANLLESTRASIPELQIDLQQAENALCTLIGRPTGCAQPLLAGPNAIPTVPGPVAVSVPAEMLRRRPDIRGAELRAVAQCDRIGVAKSDLFPKLVLFGSIGTQTVTSSGAPSGVSNILNLFNPGTLIYSVGANLLWPILAYPQILNNVRVQDARLQQFLVDYQNTVLKAAQEVENGIVGFLREQEAAAFAQNAVTAAQTSVKLALVQYREGATDYQRVVDTQRSLLQSQNSLARTRSAVATNLIALYKALGGGWEMRQGQPVVTDRNRVEMQKRTNWGSYFAKPPQPPPQSPQANGSPPTHR